MMRLALIPIALAAAAALAEPPPGAAANGGLDPNQVICRSEPLAGSRLRGARRCATRAQWIEQARLERQYVEKAQTSRTFCGGICVRRRGHAF